MISSDSHEKIQLMGTLAFELQYSDTKKAIEIGKQALDMAILESDQDVNYCTNILGLLYEAAEQNDSALFYLQRTYDSAFEGQDTVFMSKALNNIGMVYINLGQYESGLDKMRESGQLDFAIGDKNGAAISFMNVGSIQVQLDLLNEARINLVQALDIFQALNDKNNEANVFLSLGALELKAENVDEGKQYFFRAISIQENQNDLDGVARSYSNLAFAFRQQKKFKIALVYDLKSLEYAEKLNSPGAKEAAFKGMASTYEGMNDFESALNNYKLYMAWRDTVQDQENRSVLIEMQEKYNSVQTTKENEILIQQNKIETLQNEENKARLGQSKIIIISSVIGLLLVVGIALVLFNRNRLKQKANAELSVAYQTIQLSNEQLTTANNIIQEKNDDITASMEYASKIQEALLPTKENAELFKDSFFILMPKDIVSGDFLWYSKIGSKVIFAAADCTGHGVPGAFMSMIGNTFLHQIVNEEKVSQPSVILDQLRERVITALRQEGQDNARKDGMDMALCSLDIETRELQFAGANNPLYYTKDNDIVELKGDKQPVGYMPERSGPFTNHKIDLNEGDAIYIFSDGYPDQFGGPKGKKFKYKQLRDLFLANSQKPMLTQKDLLISSFYAWKGDLEQIDDVCVIGVRV